MGSYMNFKSFGEPTQPEGSGGNFPLAPQSSIYSLTSGNFPLARQSSIYSLTFDELQNTLGGPGKDFGSMNMDELLKNIWTAEESQAMASSTGGGVGGGGGVPGGNLQRLGSLTLPRTVSQKTVDDIWKDLLKESGIHDLNGSEGSNVPQRQQTLGEMTLEEFLARAGVVREDPQPIGRPNNGGGFYGEILQSNNNSIGLSLGFQQSAPNQGVLANQNADNTNAVSNLTHNLATKGGGIRSSQQQLQQQQLFPKQSTVVFTSPMNLVNNAQMGSPGTRPPVSGMADHSINAALVQGSVLQSGAIGMSGLGTGPKRVVAGSTGNQFPLDVIVKNNMDTSSLSTSPYAAFTEGVRGRKSNGGFEKVVERRRKRMIKNRESAARSRARKQAYTLELEAEIEKLKEINQELLKKHADLVEMQKNQILATMNMPRGGKRRCLERTLTGPW